MSRETRRRSGEFRFAGLVFLAAWAAAAWALVRLFPLELRQTWQWLQATLGALFR